MPDNALLPTKAAMAEPVPDEIAALHPAMAARHDQLAGVYSQTSKAMAATQRYSKGLDSLLKMGQAVTPEDVIAEAGKIVAAGEPAERVAGLLADMPETPGALPDWLAAHKVNLAQQMAQLAQAHEAVRHALAVSSLHAVAHFSLNPQSPSPALNPQSADANLLTMPTAGNA